jgi:hypothetical protein
MARWHRERHTRGYDRWNYMPEKRAAMKKWNAFVQAMLNKKRPKAVGEKRAPLNQDAAEEPAQRAA